MNNRMFALVSAAAVIAAGACNRDEQAAAPPAGNQVDGGGNADAGAPVDVAKVMHDRHENYEDMGRAMKGITRQLKADAPAIAEIQRHSAVIAGFAPQVPGWFPPGSGPEAGRTRAKAEIWAEPDRFRAGADRLRQAAVRFDAAARSGDLAAVRAALPELQDSCKNCHDRYRGPEHD